MPKYNADYIGSYLNTFIFICPQTYTIYITKPNKCYTARHNPLPIQPASSITNKLQCYQKLP